MNFIIIVSDTLRRDHLGCYGNSWISTPHIDAFAEKSLVFDFPADAVGDRRVPLEVETTATLAYALADPRVRFEEGEA